MPTCILLLFIIPNKRFKTCSLRIVKSTRVVFSCESNITLFLYVMNINIL